MVERKSKGYRTADEVRGWLQHHGYALEHETAEAFRRAGFRAFQGRTYLDRDEGKPRDIDVVIQVADDSLPVALHGVAECKARTLGAWIVREAPSAYDDDLWTPAGRNSLRQAGRDFAIDVAMSLPVSGPDRDYLPFSIVEAAERDSGRTSSTNPAFDAGRQAVSAAGGWAAELQRDQPRMLGGSPRPALVFPMIVVDAPVFGLRYDRYGEPDLRELTTCRVLWAHPEGPGQTAVQVITRAALEENASALAVAFEGLADRLRSRERRR